MNKIELLERILMGTFRTKILVFLLASIVCMSLGYPLMLRALMNQHSMLKIEMTELNATLKSKQHQISSFHALRQALVQQTQSAQYAFKKLAIPVSNTLDYLSHIGLQQGMSFELFNPLSEKEHLFCHILPVHLVMIGNYHQFMRFFMQMIQSNALIAIQDLVLTRKSAQTEETEQLNLDIKADIYYVLKA